MSYLSFSVPKIEARYSAIFNSFSNEEQSTRAFLDREQELRSCGARPKGCDSEAVVRDPISREKRNQDQGDMNNLQKN